MELNKFNSVWYAFTSPKKREKNTVFQVGVTLGDMDGDLNHIARLGNPKQALVF